MPTAMAVMDPGTEFGGYRIERLLGAGGFCNVYLAEDLRPALKRRVALKVLNPALSADHTNRERFLRESLLAVELDDHPNIVDVHDAGEHDGQLYIAQRFIDGHDLFEEIAEHGPLAPARAVEVISAIGGALDYAHAAGLVHRDVKTRNILIRDRDDHCFLADFGLTKRTAAGNSLTGAGEFLGTFAYAAPEQLGGQPVDGRADLYALGCCLFESLTGSPPFSGDMHTMITSHLTKPPPRASESTPGVPVTIDAVIERAMAKEPGDRYPSGRDLAEAAREALASTEATPVRRSTVSLPAMAPVPVPNGPSQAVAPPPPPPPESPPPAPPEPTWVAPPTEPTPAAGTIPVEPASAAPPSPVPETARHPVLEVHQPGRATLYVQLRDELEVGRDCDGLLLADDEVSRRHALFSCDATGVSVADLGSTNGTFVDGVRVDGHRQLTSESVVRVGTTTVRALTEPEPAQPRGTRVAGDDPRGTMISDR